MDRNATLLCWLFCFEEQSHILHLYFSFFLLCSCVVRHRVRYLSLESTRSMFDPCRCQLMPLYNMLSLNSIGFILAAFQGHRVSAGAHQPKQKYYFSTMLHVTHVLQKNTNLTHPGWKIASPARMRRYASSPITGSAVLKPPEMAETLSCSFRSFYGRHSPHSVVWQCCGGDRLSNKPWPLQPVTSPPPFSC